MSDSKGLSPEDLKAILADPSRGVSRDGRAVAFVAWDAGADEDYRLIVRYDGVYSALFLCADGFSGLDGVASFDDLLLRPEAAK